jgi:hypothetical protein
MKMITSKLTPLLAAAALGLAPAGAAAQTAAPTTAPMTAPSPSPMQPAPAPTSMSEPSAAPSTSAPSSGSSSSSSTPAPKATMSTNPSQRGTGGTPNKLANVKKIPNGSMNVTDLRYALTHPLVEANKVRQMKHVSFDKLRVYRLSSGLKSMLKVGDANADIPALAILGPGTLVAQTTGLPGTNGSNSPIAYLQYVLANINVSNALNNVNVLNNSTVNVGVSLQDVLNGNKISIGQVAGIFVNGLGIITTITK